MDHATINGIHLAYLDTGGSDPVVLLVHGFALDHRMWQPQIEALSSHWRVIAPDLRGFGDSEPGPDGPLTMTQHADDLVALLDHLEVRDAVRYVGLSMGGYIAFELWRRHPRRVSAMILADTKATHDDAERRAYRETMAREAELEGTPAASIRMMWPSLCSPSLPLEAAVPQELRRIMESQSARAIAEGQRGMASRADSVPLLPSIAIPTLVVVGEDDSLTPPAESHLMANMLPRTGLMEIPTAGHMSNMEAPDVFNQLVLGWLARL